MSDGLSHGSAAGGDAFHIRPLDSLDDYRACVALQEETWGAGFSERVPPAILKVSRLLGGVASGAFTSDGHLAGFVFGMTGLRDGAPVHWSDMLAVRPAHRNRGLGRLLKLHQREEVMRLGVHRMHWTFDPLRPGNAHLNFNRLGSVAPEYVEQMYGDTDSPLHRGIGTDRFVVLWELDSPHVKECLAGAEHTPDLDEASSCPAALTATPEPPPAGSGGTLDTDGDPAHFGNTGPAAHPGHPRLDLDADRIRVAIPADIGALMEHDPALALAWRRATRAVFGHYLARGWVVRHFLRHPRTPAYLLHRES